MHKNVNKLYNNKMLEFHRFNPEFYKISQFKQTHVVSSNETPTGLKVGLVLQKLARLKVKHV